LVGCRGFLVLSDGTVFRGTGFGAQKTHVGELVFSTAMTGYQEALTDPSYAGQILMMTYPLVGNYGINGEDSESDKIWARGFVVHEACLEPVHSKSKKSIDEFLEEQGVPGVAGLDTRAIVHKIRDKGVMPACIYAGEEEPDIPALAKKAAALDYSGINFVDEVSPREPREFGKGKKRVVLVDCGAKANIVRELVKRGIRVTTVHYKTSARAILDLDPDGVVVSNGPGDPALMQTTAAAMRAIAKKLPTMGICLGHQILGIAAGGSTFKLKFGHRSANQPVKELETGRVFITTQNHGYAVDGASIGKDWVVTMLNANDGTVEGLRHRELPVFSVQFHPEAHPGPRDTGFLFDEFVKSL